MLSNFKKLFIYIVMPTVVQAQYYTPKNFTIMLDPAGDAKTIGRSLHQGFERGATLQFAQELRRQILNQYPLVNVIISRSAGETLEKLQSASFANRLNVDLFLSLNFYKETSVKPHIFIYQYQNQSFFSKHQANLLDFYPYHQAYILHFDQTKNWALSMQKWLQRPDYKHYFTCMPVISLPFKPLAGVIAPAIGLEIGLKNNGYEMYLAPIVNSLSELVYVQ